MPKRETPFPEGREREEWELSKTWFLRNKKVEHPIELCEEEGELEIEVREVGGPDGSLQGRVGRGAEGIFPGRDADQHSVRPPP